MSAVTRIGDADAGHCSAMVRAQGSGNVFVNGIPVSCQTHSNTVHLLPGSPCPPHSAKITKGSGTVFVNGLGIGRISDDVGPACTNVAAGSKNVFAGG